MLKTLFNYLGSGAAAAAALLIGGRIALADPPRVEPAAPGAVRETPREAARFDARDARATARDVRIDRRARRAPGELGLRLGAIADRGLAIANLVNNSVFYNAGIRPGDYIVSINGHRILAPGDFDRYLYALGPDQPVQVVVWRNGADQTIVLQPNVLYADNPVETYDTDLAYFGVEFDPQYTDRLVIRRVLPDTLAFRAGLRAGDVITTWNGAPVRSPRAFAQVIHNEKPGRVAFDYTREGKTVRGDVAFDRRSEPRTALKPVTPPGQEPGRDNIPKLNPPAGREPIPTVKPPAGREPVPTVTPPTGREPPRATPPTGREPPSATPPAGREPPRATPPAGRTPGTAPTGREPPRANPPTPSTVPPGGPAPTAPVPREK